MADVRNPSPPRDSNEGEDSEEIQASNNILKADLIKDTAYSKQWLFSAVLKLVKNVEGLVEEGSSETASRSVTRASAEATGNGTGPVIGPRERIPRESPLTDEKLDAILPTGYMVLDRPANRAGDRIDDETEEELCQLWDMTSNAEVVRLLLEYNAIDLLVGAIYKSVGVEPRYTEIAVGILGNMACQKVACAVMASNTKVMELIYWILQISTDAPLLVETTRLVTTIFESIKEQETTPWIETLYGRCVIKKPILPLIEDKTVLATVSTSTESTQILKPDPATTPSISKSIDFILKSSTRLDLLRNTLKFVNQIFECERAADLVSALMHMWVVEYDMIVGLLECWKVIHDDHEDISAIDSWIHVMYLICQTCDMETRRSDRTNVSLKVGIIGKLPKHAHDVLAVVEQYLRWCLEGDVVETKWFISIACSFNICQALLIYSMTSLDVIEINVKLLHRILAKWPIKDLKRRLLIKDRDHNQLMTDKLLKYTYDSVFSFFSFVFEKIIRDRQSPIIQDVVRTFEKCPMSTLKSLADILDNWHRDEKTLSDISPLNPGIGAFQSTHNPLPVPKEKTSDKTVAEVIGEMLKVAEEGGTKKLALVISSTTTATTYTSTMVNTKGH